MLAVKVQQEVIFKKKNILPDMISLLGNMIYSEVLLCHFFSKEWRVSVIQGKESL